MSRRDSESGQAAGFTVAHLVGLPVIPGGDGDPAQTPAAQWLIETAQRIAQDPLLAPDLLVVSGGLAVRGRKREYDQALTMLEALIGALGLPRGRVVLLPGEGDVNREACASYFMQCAAEDEEAEPPFWPKWKQFAVMFGQFYRDVENDGALAAAFAPGEPWTLIEIPELKVVVAGLNSTIAISHRDEDGYGSIGEQQAEWFASRLPRYEERGWLRIGAVYHDPVLPEGLRDGRLAEEALGTHLNLILSGNSADRSARHLTDQTPVLGAAAVPAAVAGDQATGFELLQVTADSLVRWTAQEAMSGLSSEVLPFSPQHAEATFPSLPGRSTTSVAAAPEAGAWTRRPEDFAHRVEEICTLRYPSSNVSLVEPTGDIPMYLRVTSVEDGFVTQRPVGLAENGVAADTLARFVQHVHQNFAAADPYLVSELVYGGPRASDDLIREARGRAVNLRSFVEYQGLMDLRGYLLRQTERLDNSRLYPPPTYVPQRFRILGGDPDPREDLLEQTFEWLDTDEQRFQLVLGDFGLGKTFLLQELARRMPERLPHLTPMLLELRTLEKARSVDELVAQHLVAAGEKEINLDAFRYMLRKGRIVMLFDGFDELALRVSYDRAADRLQTLLQALEGRAKIIVSSRSQHFMSTRQILTALGERVERLLGARLVELVPFTDAQIREYLVRVCGGDVERADERMELIFDIRDLLGLSRNPRMLGFIARLDAARLQQVLAREGNISSADLYRELLDHWFRHEDWRASPRGAAAVLTIEDRWRAVTALALRLWRSTDQTVAAVDLSEETATALGPLADRYLDEEQAAQLVGSGTLLVRDDEGRFSFVHLSVMEWLVAAHAADQLAEGRLDPPVLALRPMSALMADFFGGLAGTTGALAWAHRVLDDEKAPDTPKRNALLVMDRLGAQQAVRARLAGRNLRGDVFSENDLREADLVDADLSAARLLRSDLSRAAMHNARLVGAVLDGVRLTGADLSDADFSEARLVRTDLTGATLTGSRWSRASLLDVTVDPGVLESSQLAEAAVVGRDHVLVERPPAVAPATAAAFSPNGRLLAFAMGQAVVIADPQTGRQLRTLAGHDDTVTSIAFSPDGRTLASGGMDRTVRLWQVADATLVQTLQDQAEVHVVAFSPDGGLLASAGPDGVVRVRPAHELTPIQSFGDDPVAVNAIAFSPDGTLLALGRADGQIRLWHVADGHAGRTMRGSTRPIHTIAFHRDGELIAAGGGDGQVRLWRIRDGVLQDTLAAHVRVVLGVGFSPDGLQLASGGGDSAARLWNLGDVSRAAELVGHDDEVTSVTFSPDGELLASTGRDGFVRIWAAAAHSGRFMLTGRHEEINDMSASWDGTVLATAGESGTVRLWRPATSACQVVTTGRAEAVFGVGFSPDGTLIGIGLGNGSIQVRRTADGAAQPSPVGTPHTGPVRKVTFSPDGKLMATAAGEGRIRLWRVSDGVRMNTLDSPTRTVSGLTFSPDGTLLATAGGDETVQFWDVETGSRPQRLLTGRERVVSAIAFNRSGSLLASGGSDGTVQLWRTAQGTRQSILKGHHGWVHGVAFSADGRFLATAGQDQAVHVWQVRDGVQVATLIGHRGTVYDLAFCPGGLLASAGADGVLLLWDVATGTQAATMIPLAAGGWATLLPDGRHKLEGDPGDAFWWAIKLCRFGPGELDAPRDRSVIRLPVSTSLSPKSRT